ncbi:methionine adenosyltransferase, partial [Listeria monocytogenes]|nr:methionine adenosyltransferase [Listeria monocytogenes]
MCYNQSVASSRKDSQLRRCLVTETYIRGNTKMTEKHLFTSESVSEG